MFWLFRGMLELGEWMNESASVTNVVVIIAN